MKTKLNIFCLLIFAVIIVDILMATDLMFSGMVSGYKSAKHTQEANIEGVDGYRVVSLIPDEITWRNAITLTDSATKKSYKAWPTQINLPIEESPSGTAGAILSVAIGLAIMVAGIITLVSFIRFVLNINRNNIFTRKNTRYLKRIGWCMIIIGLLATLKYCNDIYAATQTFSLTGYSIDYAKAVYTGTILFGLFSLVMAESFSIGLKMKEEQELTI